MAEVVFSVSQINDYLSRKLFRDPFLSAVTIVGEVTNVSMSSIGHAFFSLKDENSLLNCIVYDFVSSPLQDVIQSGALIKASGRIVFYKKNSMFQLAIDKASLQGVGDLYLRLEVTKKKLREEGLFDLVHKKALPRFPMHLGLVTSAAGAAMHDIISVATRRFEGIHITVYPAQVQGASAAGQICRGIEYFNALGGVDVIIVGRGGGSFEDLFAFNEESVARAVFNSVIPVVSAVGHETDYSLCDMAADLRAPTPSAAAELVVPDKSAFAAYVRDYKNKLFQSLDMRVKRDESRIAGFLGTVKAFAFDQRRERINDAVRSARERMKNSAMAMIERAGLSLEKQRSRLEDLNPKGVLNRGYALIYDENNHVITSKKRAQKRMDIEFADGRVAVTRTGKDK